MRRLSIPLFAAALAATLAPSVAAQRPGMAELRARMHSFVSGNSWGGTTFFPTRGEWVWVPTTHHEGGPDAVGRFHIPAEMTEKALDTGGPVCESFGSAETSTLGSIVSTLTERPGAWRNVGGTRFVPPGARRDSPVFVEWRREDDRWVISSFGDERFVWKPSAELPPNSIVRDSVPGAPLILPMPADAPYADGNGWIAGRPFIYVNRHPLNVYGLPRSLGPGDVVRYGTVNGIAVYVEPGFLRHPDVLWVAVSADGMFQPYQNMLSNGCSADFELVVP